MINYTKKGTNAENFMQISLLLKKIWYLKDSRNGHFAMHYSSFKQSRLLVQNVYETKKKTNGNYELTINYHFKRFFKSCYSSVIVRLISGNSRRCEAALNKSLNNKRTPCYAEAGCFSYEIYEPGECISMTT